MDTLPLHPKLVHLPIALAVLMPLIASGTLLAWWRGWFRRRTWIIVTALQALLVIGGLTAMKTGQQEEERVERVVPEAKIHAHEEAAETFVWAAAGVLVLMLAAGLVASEEIGRVIGVVAVAGTLAVFYLGYRTGHLGGTLVYRYDAPRAYATGSGGTPPAAPAPDRDDD